LSGDAYPCVDGHIIMWFDVFAEFGAEVSSLQTPVDSMFEEVAADYYAYKILSVAGCYPIPCPKSTSSMLKLIPDDFERSVFKTQHSLPMALPS